MALQSRRDRTLFRGVAGNSPLWRGDVAILRAVPPQQRRSDVEISAFRQRLANGVAMALQCRWQPAAGPFAVTTEAGISNREIAGLLADILP